jgi:hypothetical protein
MHNSAARPLTVLFYQIVWFGNKKDSDITVCRASVLITIADCRIPAT